MRKAKLEKFETIAMRLKELGWVPTGAIFRPAAGGDIGVFVIHESDGSSMVFGDAPGKDIPDDVKAALGVPLGARNGETVQ